MSVRPFATGRDVAQYCRLFSKGGAARSGKFALARRLERLARLCKHAWTTRRRIAATGLVLRADVFRAIVCSAAIRRAVIRRAVLCAIVLRRAVLRGFVRLSTIRR